MFLVFLVDFLLAKLKKNSPDFEIYKKRKLPQTKPQTQSYITQFFKNNKKMSLTRLNVEKNTAYLFFRNPFLPQTNTFSFGQKGYV